MEACQLRRDVENVKDITQCYVDSEEYLRAVHTSPVEFENRGLSPGLGLPSTLIRFENSLQTGGICKRWLFCFRVELFVNTARHDDHVISLTVFYSSTNPKWPMIVAFSNFFDVVWTESI